MLKNLLHLLRAINHKLPTLSAVVHRKSAVVVIGMMTISSLGAGAHTLVDEGISDVDSSHSTKMVQIADALNRPNDENPAVAEDCTVPQDWWDSERNYRLHIQVGAAGYERYDKPVEQIINFSFLLDLLDESAAFDANSIRVVEVDQQGNVLNNAVPFQFDEAANYNAQSNATGSLVFILEGVSAANTTRYFHAYFDAMGSVYTPVNVSGQVSLVDNVQDEGQESYKITTQNATYFYHKEGAGFSSIVDIDDNDWVNYHPDAGSGSAGEYRGLPNMNKFAHPGNTGSLGSDSTIMNQGPLKVTIYSERHDHTSSATWEFFPHYAKMTLHSMHSTYFWGYEGTPGGTMDPSTDYVVRSDGQSTPLSQDWHGDLSAPEWLYFGDPNVDRTFYLIHHEDDNHSDQYWTLDNNMTVFGFGRQYKCCQPYMDTFPAHFTIGFASASTFDNNAKVIDSSYQDISAVVVAIESSCGDIASAFSNSVYIPMIN